MARVLFEILPKNIGKITLNDPDNLNAMGEDMAAEFRALVAQIQGESRKLRAIILTGAGRAFSAGGNLDMLEAKSRLSGEENRLKMLEFYHSFLGILKLGVPLIAAINGHAVGAGLCLACGKRQSEAWVYLHPPRFTSRDGRHVFSAPRYWSCRSD